MTPVEFHWNSAGMAERFFSGKALKILKFNSETDMFTSNINYQFHNYFSCKEEKAEAILVVLYWPNQAWFSVLLKMLIDKAVLITSRKNLLKLPQYPELVHPMRRKIDMVVYHLAGSSQKAMEFQNNFKTYWKHCDNRQQEKDMLGMYRYLHNIVINKMPIPFKKPPK